MAHPYGPLGGSQDDPVVDTVGCTILRQGFLLATFNFRGGGGSAGRTSWTGRAERADYASVTGFVYHYVHFLLTTPSLFSPLSSPSPSAPASPLLPPAFSLAPTPVDTTMAASPNTTPILLLGGYSYGSMITTLLPPLPTLLAPFTNPTDGTPAAEIRLRAEHLAVSQLAAAQRAQEKSHGSSGGRSSSHRRSLGVRIGGGEDVRRASTDSRRSFSLDLDRVLHRHKGSPEKVHKRAKSRGGDGVSAPPTVIVSKGAERPVGAGAGGHSEQLPSIPNLYRPQVAYLLVSPPIGIVTNLATMSFATPLFPKRSRSSAGAWGQDDDAEAEAKLLQNPTLAVYGDSDSFSSSKKIRAWTGRLTTAAGSRFVSSEVVGAGHFWVEEGAMRVLRGIVGKFSSRLIAGGLEPERNDD